MPRRGMMAFHYATGQRPVASEASPNAEGVALPPCHGPKARGFGAVLSSEATVIWSFIFRGPPEVPKCQGVSALPHYHNH